MDALENSVAISYEPIWQQTLSLNLAYDLASPTLWLLTLNELPANAQCSQETYLGNSEVLSTTMAHVSPRHFLSPKLFYFYLPCAQSWLFQLSHNNILISLLVPFSAPTSTGSQTNIYNDLQQCSQSYFHNGSKFSSNLPPTDLFPFERDSVSRVSRLAIYCLITLRASAWQNVPQPHQLNTERERS